MFWSAQDKDMEIWSNDEYWNSDLRPTDLSEIKAVEIDWV